MNKRIKNKIKKSIKEQHHVYQVLVYDNTKHYSEQDDRNNEKYNPWYKYFFKREDSVKKFCDFANMLEKENNETPRYEYSYIEHKLLN